MEIATRLATRALQNLIVSTFDITFFSFSGFCEISRTVTANNPKSAKTIKKLIYVVIVLYFPTPSVPK